jgi:Tfp pilus assembly protein PilE
MGQQQLLLVILVTIIVGIATVVAINTFGSSAEQANIDAVRNDIASIATSAQAWYIRPAMLEGGGNDYTDLDFNKVGFSYDSMVSATEVSNLNGTYEISSTGVDNFTIVATPRSNANVTVTGTYTVADGLSIVTTGAEGN